MKNLLFLTVLLSLFSCSHQPSQLVRSPSSQLEIVLSIDLSGKDLRVIEGGQNMGEFKIHMKDPTKHAFCKTTPPLGKFPVVRKELVYSSSGYGVIANYAIGYKATNGMVFLIKEDDGRKYVHGGHCGVMLSDGNGSKLFALIEKAKPKDITVEIFE